MRNIYITLLLVLAAGLSSSAAFAQLEVPQPVTVHPWQAPIKLNAEAYFTNLPSDGKIETPFLLKFGLAGGWGLAPIAKPLGGKSGHHHLLVNTELPLDIEKAIPFSEKYVHFGKGQMETVLNLEPGVHTLRLLLANDAHKLHFVYSKATTITVTKKNSGVDPKSLVQQGVSLLNVKPVEKLDTPFRVQFHASGLNVAHLQQKEKNTGHFRLVVAPANGAKPVELDFTNGQTETWLAPPVGAYSLKLYLLDNTAPGKALAEAPGVPVVVK
jgi:Domain of unknown function (DUF4399)